MDPIDKCILLTCTTPQAGPVAHSPPSVSSVQRFSSEFSPPKVSNQPIGRLHRFDPPFILHSSPVFISTSIFGRSGLRPLAPQWTKYRSSAPPKYAHISRLASLSFVTPMLSMRACSDRTPTSALPPNMSSPEIGVWLLLVSVSEEGCWEVGGGRGGGGGEYLTTNANATGLG